LLGGFEADQLSEEVSVMKTVCEKRSEVALDDDLDLNSKLEKFLMCEMESYFNSHTYNGLCRINLDPEDLCPLMPCYNYYFSYNFGIYYHLNLFV
jgi:hypothetical protein